MWWLMRSKKDSYRECVCVTGVKCTRTRHHSMPPRLAKARKVAAAAEVVLEPDKPKEGLACPICMDIFTGQVAQCKDGHLICDNCYYNLVGPKRCPSCRTPMPDFIRNRAFENVLADIKVKCMWRGCTHICTIREMKSHSFTCSKRTRPCGVIGCNWKGYEDEVVDHCNTKHEGNATSSECGIFVYAIPETVHSASRIIICRDKVYFLCLSHIDTDDTENIVQCSVLSFGDTSARFQLTLQDGNDSIVITSHTVSVSMQYIGTYPTRRLLMEAEGGPHRCLHLKFL